MPLCGSFSVRTHLVSRSMVIGLGCNYDSDHGHYGLIIHLHPRSTYHIPSCPPSSYSVRPACTGLSSSLACAVHLVLLLSFSPLFCRPLELVACSYARDTTLLLLYHAKPHAIARYDLSQVNDLEGYLRIAAALLQVNVLSAFSQV